MLSVFVFVLLSILASARPPHVRRLPKVVPDSPMKDLPPPPPYKTLYFNQTLDHFRYRQPKTFAQRYLWADQYWNSSFPGGCPGPIFFYTGNESPVTDYYDASGFITQVLAPQHNALLIFAEHRYFGESLPFGNQSFNKGNIDYLSSEQALADYALLLTTIKETVAGASNCPVVSFGGSYGGMLTAWFRLKYPHIVIGGLSASAPFNFYGTGISPYAFDDAATDTINQAAAGCGDTIVAARNTMYQLATTQQGRNELTQKFLLCSPLVTEAQAYDLINWVDAGWEDMCMLDYPYPADYGIQYPAWPINASCDRLLSIPNDLVSAMAYAIGVAYNATGQYSCYDIQTDVPDWGTGDGWPYLACTEIYLPFGGSGCFPQYTYNLSRDVAECFAEFEVDLRYYWGKIEFAGFDFSSASNIIFSNGLLDPWHSCGLVETLNPTLPAIVIPEAAHHLDLRAPNDADPSYVTNARAQEESIISGWLKDYWGQLKLKLKL